MAKTILLDVWVLARLAGAAMDDAVASAGLVSREFVLYALLEQAGPMTPTELARMSGVPATTISKMVRRMAERDHLVELENPDDARSRLLELSPRGQEVLGEAEAGYASLADGVAAALGGELDQVEWSLERLRATLAQRSGRSGDAGLGSRPPGATAHEFRYTGRPLTRAEESQVGQFADFLRRDD